MPNLIHAHFWDFLGIHVASWYWPDFRSIQDNSLRLVRTNLNFRQECGFQENSSFSNSLKIQSQWQVNGANFKKTQAAITSKLFQENQRRDGLFFLQRDAHRLTQTCDNVMLRQERTVLRQCNIM